MRRTVAAAALLLAGASGAAGQERAPIDVEVARRVAHEWLTEGRAAPRPGLERERSARAAAEVMDLGVAAHRGPVLELRFPPRPPHAFAVGVSRAGRVVAYSAFDEAFLVERFRDDGSPRPEAAVADEVAARSRYDAAGLRERARAFLAGAYRGFERRSFARVRDERHTDSNPILHHFTWQEEAGEDALACYPNRIVVAMNPETGRVVGFVATRVAARVTEPPPVERAAAERRARAEHPGARVRAAALSMILRDGRARAVWCVHLAGEGLVLVSAEDGSLLPLRED